MTHTATINNDLNTIKATKTTKDTARTTATLNNDLNTINTTKTTKRSEHTTHEQ